MRVLTEFGAEVKKRLIDIGQTQEWLIARVSEMTGLYLDNSYMYKILTGKNAAPKITAAIKTVLNMDD